MSFLKNRTVIKSQHAHNNSLTPSETLNSATLQQLTDQAIYLKSICNYHKEHSK